MLLFVQQTTAWKNMKNLVTKISQWSDAGRYEAGMEVRLVECFMESGALRDFVVNYKVRVKFRTQDQ